MRLHQIPTLLAFAVCSLAGIPRGAEGAWYLDKPGASVTVRDAILQQVAGTPAGLALRDCFLALQGTPGEAGINTDATPYTGGLKDVFSAHSLRISDLAVSRRGQLDYTAFVLDIDQPVGSQKLVMNYMRLYASPFNNLTSNVDFRTRASAVYSTGSQDAIVMDGALGGPTPGDLLVYMPMYNFVNLSPDLYLYLDCSLGYADGYESMGGPERWYTAAAVTVPPPVDPPGVPVPEPGTAAMLGLGVALLAARWKKRSKGQGGNTCSY